MKLFTPKKSLSAYDSLQIANCHLEFTEAYAIAGDPDLATEHVEEALRWFRNISIAHRRNIGKAYTLMSMRGSSFYSGPEMREWVLKKAKEADKFLCMPTDKVMALYAFGNALALAVRLSNMPDRKSKLREAHELAIKWGINRQPYHYTASKLALENYDLQGATQHAFQSLEEFHQEYGLEDCSKISRGISYLFIGIALHYQMKYDSSSFYLQRTIEDFSIHFKGDDISQYPTFEDGIARNLIFEALRLKGLNWYQKHLLNGNLNDLKMAFSTFVAALKITTAMRRQFREDRGKLNLSGIYANHCEGVIKTGLRLYEITGDTTYFNQSYWASEIAKSQLLLESTSKSKVLRSLGVPKYMLRIEDSLKREAAYLRGQLLDADEQAIPTDIARTDRLKKQLADTKKALRAGEALVEKYYPESASKWKSRTIPTIDDLQKTYLKEAEALVEYFVGKEELYVFFITPDTALGQRFPRPETFTATIDRFRNSIANYAFVVDSASRGYTQFTATAHQLYEWLLAPFVAEQHLPKSLTVIPDVSLNELPFEALLTAPATSEKIDFGSLPYLLKRSRVQYSPSAALLMKQPERTLDSRASEAPMAGCLGIAPGEFGGTETTGAGDLARFRAGFGALQGGLEEVGVIGDLGIPGQYLIGDSATESKFKALGPQFQIIHLATHGKADFNNPD
ncbi:MAG: CHAT domain-containing protein, partial [Bacteroidota bacterium]